MNLVADKSDGALAICDGVVVAILAGGVVDKRTVVHDHLRVLHHQNQDACARVDGTVSHETAAVDGDGVERANEGDCALVANEVASIDEYCRSTGHVSFTNHGSLHP